MSPRRTPNPIFAFIASVVALVCYLQASDAETTVSLVLCYGSAVAGVGYFWFFVVQLDRGRFGERLAHVLSQIVAMLGIVLILVGAGYCSNLEPSVLKLAGVLPLGWSCAIIVLLKEQTKQLEQRELNHRVPRRLGWWLGLLIVMTIFQFADDLSGHHQGNGDMIKWALQIWLVLGALELVIHWARLLRAVMVKRE